MGYQDILKFWFEEISPKDQFVRNDEVDAMMIERFSELHTKGTAGDLTDWTETAEGSLALIVLLDQFSRNMFRGDNKSYAQDEMALNIAKQTIKKGFDYELTDEQRRFVYMPYMHSESKASHAEAVPLFESLNDPETLKYEHIHKDIVDRFGRYPHRNECMERDSTPEEIEYLENNQESFF